MKKLPLLTLCVVILASCNEARTTSDVSASVSPITDLVAQVGAGVISVRGLIPEGVNAHTFEPAPSDVRALKQSSLLFVNGLGLEESLVELGGRETKVVRLGETTVPPGDRIFDFSFPREGGSPNPHLWTNPPYAMAFVEAIAAELKRKFPGSTAIIKGNEDALKRRLEDLDAAIRSATASVPPENRKLLTYHDSFPYFAREYGWSVIGAIQPVDFSEPTPREVARLIEQIKTEGVRAIFGSEVFPSPVLEQIAAQSGARYVAELRDDDLPGEPGDPEHSYIGLMKFDVSVIVEALGGDATALKTVDGKALKGTDATY